MIKVFSETFQIHSPKHGGYKANIVSIEISDNGIRKDITFWKAIGLEKEGAPFGSEVYSGPNYVKPFDSRAKSYSQNYNYLKDLPKKYVPVVNMLMNRHKQIFG